jgi:lipopolysaccharide transport system permease protein
MAKRDVIGRYKGSTMGLLWSLINPIFMLAVYTLVFSVVFKARWAGAAESESKTQFAVILFVGLIVHGLFSEVLNRAPSLIISNANYVKKVVFPLEILPIVTLLATLFHSLVSILVLIIAFVVFNGFLYWTVIFAPLIFIPLLFLTLGLAWFIASLGVYIRDVGQTVSILMIVTMYLSTVFYPITSLPVNLRPLILLNPLTFIIEQARAVLIWGELPNFVGLGIYTLISIVVMWFGYVWFQKTRKGFADVL